jgi:hypothetical protein
VPEIPVPLASPDRDVPLALDAVYERSRYARRIDYAKPLYPPLTAEQAACIHGLIRSESRAGKLLATRQRRGQRR